MKEIKAYIRRERINQVVKTLEKLDAPGITIVEIHRVGYGYEPNYFPAESMDVFERYGYLAIVKREIVCGDEQVERLVKATQANDGRVASWAVVASLPFAPKIVLPTIQHINEGYPKTTSDGLKASFNPTYSNQSETDLWLCKWCYGIDQGPVVLMIENYRSELLWRLMRRCPYLVRGLRRAGFAGGWL